MWVGKVGKLGELEEGMSKKQKISFPENTS